MGKDMPTAANHLVIRLLRENSHAFASAITQRRIDLMQAIIDLCGPFIAMFPIFYTMTGRKLSPMYHCIMEILSVQEKGDENFRTQFEETDTLVLKPSGHPHHLDSWIPVLNKLSTTICSAQETYRFYSGKMPQQRYGLYAPYESAIWNSDGEHFGMLDALVNAGGDCTLQRGAECYLSEWARLQRRQRRVAWIAKLVCAAPVPYSVLALGQYQLAYDLQLDKGGVDYKDIIRMLLDPMRSDTGNGILTTLCAMKKALKEVTPFEVCPSCRDVHPVSLKVLLCDLTATGKGDWKKSLLFDRIIAMAEPAAPAAPTPEAEYSQAVRRNALLTILRCYYNKVISYEIVDVSNIIPSFQIAMANPLSPPLSTGC